ncbi:MAG: CtsR family transcriptional regulator [Firmicutes bacterium]|nr:CtsR family transcriptional regulator [Bacillota bacterium]MBQ6811244.1 CtsR family transcriptional regulator [Bacillota bacterium]
MSTLASRIERYIKDMMDATERNCLELKRKELAEVFSCVPSQINYVLETRFRDEQGYHVVSRRGAGGCFQIIRLEVTEDKEMKDLISAVSGSEMSYRTAEGFLGRLLEEKVLDRSEYMLIMSMIGPETLGLAGEQENRIRAMMIKNVLITLLRMDY